MRTVLAVAMDVGGVDGGELWWVLARLAVALLVVLPLAYGMTYLYSRRMTASRSGRALRLIDAVHLGSHRSIVLLEVAGRVLVIGATPHHIATLAEVSDPEAARNLVQVHGSEPTVNKAFARLLEAKFRSAKESKDGGEGN